MTSSLHPTSSPLPFTPPLLPLHPHLLHNPPLNPLPFLPLPCTRPIKPPLDPGRLRPYFHPPGCWEKAGREEDDRGGSPAPSMRPISHFRFHALLSYLATWRHWAKTSQSDRFSHRRWWPITALLANPSPRPPLIQNQGRRNRRNFPYISTNTHLLFSFFIK